MEVPALALPVDPDSGHFAVLVPCWPSEAVCLGYKQVDGQIILQYRLNGRDCAMPLTSDLDPKNINHLTVSSLREAL